MFLFRLHVKKIVDKSTKKILKEGLFKQDAVLVHKYWKVFIRVLRGGEFPRKKSLVGKGKCLSVIDFY